MYVIGTAGHVDHGKSTLVKALTGIDPDRLREEKERGLTIDLGFAWLILPSGRQVSIVDVPGHERFIKNMLAGVGGIDLALLVVAADESVMPQTREHLAILDLLEIQVGLVAITKSELVETEMLELVREEVADVLQGTALAEAPIVAVSAITGQGCPELLDALDRLIDTTPPKSDLGRPRLPIDRSFTMTGFGTIVTGTLIDGSLSVGDEVELLPTGIRSRIRGLQIHKKKVQTVSPGNRIATNLASIPHENIERGHVLTTPGWLRATISLDVRLRIIQDAPYPVRHNTGVTFHSGSGECLARLRLLGKDQVEPGEESWAQLKLERPLTAVRGDFFIIRSSEKTLGGGTILEPHARRHRRFHQPTLDHLEVLATGTPRDLILDALERNQPCGLVALQRQTNLTFSSVQQLIKELVETNQVIELGEPSDSDTFFYAAGGWEGVRAHIRSLVERYHERYPVRKGLPREELRSRLRLPQGIFTLILRRIFSEQVFAEDGKSVRLSTHQVKLSASQKTSMEEYIQALKSDPNAPPTNLKLEPDLLNLLVDERRVIKVSEDIIFEVNAYESMVEQIVQRTRELGTITVAQVRDLLGTSRKYVLSLMEHLDQERITRRVGDERILR